MKFSVLRLFMWTAAVSAVLAVVRIAPGPIIVFGLPIALIVLAVASVAGVKGHDWWTANGMALGIALGIGVGVTSELGYRLSEILEPGEPPHFNATKFGTIFGAIGGAFIGALLGGIAGIIARRIQAV